MWVMTPIPNCVIYADQSAVQNQNKTSESLYFNPSSNFAISHLVKFLTATSLMAVLPFPEIVPRLREAINLRLHGPTAYTGQPYTPE